MTTAFSANLNKIALLRNQRSVGYPDVLRAGEICIRSGASGLTLHPRPDERHTRVSDVHQVRELTRARGVECNIEGYPSAEFLDLVCRVRPDQCTLVPDWPDQRTSDHGWDALTHVDLLTQVVERLRPLGIRVSVFLDPDPSQVSAVAATGADRIELYTEPYATACAAGTPEAMLLRYRVTARAAGQLKLGVNAGHDLNLKNLPRFLAEIPEVLEVSIGHALIADAIERSLADAVRAYVAVCSGLPEPPPFGNP